MRKRIRKILVTGGAGFIGSEFVRQAVKGGLEVTVIDKLTYAGDLRRLKGIPLRFHKADICDKKAIELVIKRRNPDTIVNFAAESHVDRSILKPQDFIATNVTGTQVLLDAAKKHAVGLFCQISTDEIYGDIKKGEFTEKSPFLISP